MTPPFFCLLAAAGILRLLSADSNKAFLRRLSLLLPRKVMQDHLRVLLEDYPERLGEFRWHVLPFSALHVAFNACACGCFVAALWFFPPAGLQHWDLIFMRYGSAVLTPAAFLIDVVAFTRTLLSTFGRDAEADGAV